MTMWQFPFPTESGGACWLACLLAYLVVRLDLENSPRFPMYSIQGRKKWESDGC